MGSRPNREAFTRQLTDPSLTRGGEQPRASAAATANQTDAGWVAQPAPPSLQQAPSSVGSGKSNKADDFQPDAWRPGG